MPVVDFDFTAIFELYNENVTPCFHARGSVGKTNTRNVFPKDARFRGMSRSMLKS